MVLTYLQKFWIWLSLDILFAIFLSLLGQQFLRLIYCHQCDGTNDWSMDIIDEQKITCFGPFKDKDCTEYDYDPYGACANQTIDCMDEKCAKITKNNLSNVVNVWREYNLICHKNFLR